ncbi:MAG: DNA primase [Candidatus Ozemobacteraceae bacterium]
MQQAVAIQGKGLRRGFFTEDVISDIRGRMDISQLVGDYVRLLRTGKNFKALCPFHQEKSPSFYVVPDKQIFHCFGCGKGGDVFRFLMDMERLSFPEAVRRLARRAGVSIPEEHDPEAEAKNRLYGILEDAARFYVAGLADASAGARAREYLKKRDMKPETVREFRFGFAPDKWDALFTRLGRDPERVDLLEKAGLIKPRPNGNGFYDIFRNRLMIPILDLSGRVVGFGGRVMGEGEEPKYLNSPETDLFNKRRLLFNLKKAQNEIRRENALLVVEGYLDVISLVQAGIQNVVATLGTSITPDHIQLIARNCDKVYFCYDADEAGQKATLRAISIKRDAPLDARVISFPNPKDDPDSFVKREGAEAFRARMAAAEDIYAFLIESRTRNLKKPLEINVKERLIAEFRGLLPAVESPTARSELVKRLAFLLDMEPRALEAALFGGPVRPVSDRPVRATGAAAATANVKQQEWILRHLIDHPEDLDRVKYHLLEEDFSDPLLRSLFTTIAAEVESGNGNPTPAHLLSKLEDEALVSRLSQLMVSLEEIPPEPFMDCVRALLKYRMTRETRDLSQKIREAEQRDDSGEVGRLLALQQELRRKHEVLP